MNYLEQIRNGRGLKTMFVLILSMTAPVFLQAKQPADLIVGKWISSQGNVIVEIFKDTNSFSGRVVWFDDSDDKSYPMLDRTDSKNPNESLREQKIIGLIVLRNLVYNTGNNRWEQGKIYDVQSGKEWDASVWITKDGSLKVKGYWHFEFFGKTMTFKRSE